MQVANITTPANFFHALRRQVKREVKKPLIVMAPKSLLRHPAAVSSLSEFSSGAFQEIIDDPAYSMVGSSTRAPWASELPPPERLILCSGKVCYDLIDYRTKHQHSNTAIVRLEQLYPLRRKRIAAVARKYGAARLIWCQEESQNMGTWSFLAPQLEDIFGRKAIYAGRDASASPAVGSLALHNQELAALLKDAFTL